MTAPPEATPSGDRVQSLQRAGEVLGALLDSGTALSALEVSRSIDLNRTIVHRLLRTLQDLGLVVETAPGRYDLGPCTLLLGNAYLDRLHVRRLAIPYLVDLNNRVVRDRPWVVSLAIPVLRDAVIVEKLWQPAAPLDSILDIGTKLPFTASAMGRALLSTLSDDEARERIGTEAHEAIRERLQQVRDRSFMDFALNERQPGISALAAAIVGPDGRAAGAVAVSGTRLEDELNPSRELAMHVRRTAQAISQVLPRGM